MGKGVLSSSVAGGLSAATGRKSYYTLGTNYPEKPDESNRVYKNDGDKSEGGILQGGSSSSVENRSEDALPRTGEDEDICADSTEE